MGCSNSPREVARTKVREWLASGFRFLFRGLDRVSVRSFGQVAVHVLIALVLGVVLYFGQFGEEPVSDSNLVVILAAMAAVAGALLAVSVALAIFSSQYYTEWTYRSREGLRNQMDRLDEGMRKWVGKYPGISRRLAGLFSLMAMCIPGQRVDFDEVNESDSEFRNWVKEELEKSGRTIDFGSAVGYESFEKYAFDAGSVVEQSKDVLMEVGLAEMYGRSLATMPPAIAAWGLVLVFCLVFAIIGSLDIIGAKMNISILVVPVYLSFFAVSGVVTDYRALLRIMRSRERGYEMGKLAIMHQYRSEKHE